MWARHEFQKRTRGALTSVFRFQFPRFSFQLSAFLRRRLCKKLCTRIKMAIRK